MIFINNPIVAKFPVYVIFTKRIISISKVVKLSSKAVMLFLCYLHEVLKDTLQSF